LVALIEQEPAGPKIAVILRQHRCSWWRERFQIAPVPRLREMARPPWDGPFSFRAEAGGL